MTYTAEHLLNTGMMSALYARQKPHAVAVTDAHGQRTFQQLHLNANRFASALQASGLRRGDSVALVCGNRVEFVEVLLACLRSGLRLTPVNWHLSQNEAMYIVSDCEAKALVVESRILDSWEAIEGQFLAKISIGAEAPGFVDSETFIAGSRSADPDAPEHGTVMLYTSGTTGKPKGVYRKNPMPIAPQLSGTRASFNPDEDAQIVCGPMYHAAPLLFDVGWPLATGVPIHLLEKWESETVLREIERRKITHAHMVPIMFQRLLAVPDNIRLAADLSSLKRIYHGAAPCPPNVKRAMIEWVGPIIDEYYAGSEGGAGFGITSKEWLEKPGSVGRVPHPDAVRLLDPDGNLVAHGEDGEVYHRADESNPFAYFKAPDKTLQQTRDGYFTLGDIGRIDEDGYLFLTGRSAECIISGGVNIYPAEIDGVISAHPSVADVCVVGVPNDEWGEEVRAVVQLVDGLTESPELELGLLEHAAHNLSGFKVPRKVDFVAELPRLPSGKIPRAKVRDKYWQGRDRRI